MQRGDHHVDEGLSRQVLRHSVELGPPQAEDASRRDEVDVEGGAEEEGAALATLAHAEHHVLRHEQVLAARVARRRARVGGTASRLASRGRQRRRVGIAARVEDTVAARDRDERRRAELWQRVQHDAA